LAVDWPIKAEGRAALTELSDPDIIREADKHYFLRAAREDATEPQDFDYDSYLPLTIEYSMLGQFVSIPFKIADDCSSPQIGSVLLRIGATNLVSADVLSLKLNGQSLDAENASRTPLGDHVPYNGQWVTVDLKTVRPRQGANTLDISVIARPARLETSVTLAYMEVLISYNLFPASPRL
jgi:hypothetical protein